MGRSALVQPYTSGSIWNQPIGSAATRVNAALPLRTASSMVPDVRVILMDPTQPLSSISGQQVPIAPSFTFTPGQSPGTSNAGFAAVLADQQSTFQGGKFTLSTAGGTATGTDTAVETDDLYGSGLVGRCGATLLSTLGGVIRVGEFTNGVIPHALAVNLFGSTDCTPLNGGFMWPATKADSYAEGGGPGPAYNGLNPDVAMGTLLALPANFNIATLSSTPGKIIAQALIDYGCYPVNDTARSVYALVTEIGPAGNVETEFAGLYSMPMVSGLRDTAWAQDIETIFGALQAITNNSPSTIGGGGTPIVPLSPSLNPLGGNTPSTPTGFASSNITKTGVTLSWNASAGATGYPVTQDGLALTTVTPPTVELVLNNLTPGTNYNFTVAASNQYGSSAPAYLQVTTLPGGTNPTPPMDNVVFIILENTSLANVLKSCNDGQTPFLASLIPQGASCTNYIPSALNPSAPNYCLLTSGRQLQNGSDGYCTDTTNGHVSGTPYPYENIIDLMDGVITYGLYAEKLIALDGSVAAWANNPKNTSDTVGFAQRHFPFGMYSDIIGDAKGTGINAARVANVHDYTSFVPGRERFQWITPDIIDDAHTPGWTGGGAQNCDNWLKVAVPNILNSAAFAPGKKAVLIITFDEPEAAPGTILCLFVGPGAKSNYSSSVKYSHLSMIATWEATLGLGNLGQGDVGAPVMNDMLIQPANNGNGGTTSLTVTSSSAGPKWAANFHPAPEVASLTIAATTAGPAWSVTFSTPPPPEVASLTVASSSAGPAWAVSFSTPPANGGTASLTVSATSSSPAWAVSLTTPPAPEVASLTIAATTAGPAWSVSSSFVAGLQLAMSSASDGPAWSVSTYVPPGGGGAEFLTIVSNSDGPPWRAYLASGPQGPLPSTGPALSLGNYDFTYAIFNGKILQDSSLVSQNLGAATNSIPSYTASTMTDTTKSWFPGEWNEGLLTVLPLNNRDSSLYPIYMPVVSNTANTVTVAGSMNPVPITGSYYILQAPYQYEGQLRGVLNEPVFTADINKGCGSLTLELDHYPAELQWGYLIQPQYPDGTIVGYWKFEQRAVKMGPKNSYTVTLLPLASELTDADYTGNYSTDTTQIGPAYSPQPFSYPVLYSIPRTMHCTYGPIWDDGNVYSYAYNNAHCVDPLNQAVLFGGASTDGVGSWWWFCDRFGVVSLRNTLSTANVVLHTVTVGREITVGQWDDDILSLYNGQTVNGGTPLGSSLLTAAMNGVALPTPIITVNTMAGMETVVPAGTVASILVQTTTGTSLVSYTSVVGTSFHGCTGGTGSMQTNGSVTAAALTASYYDESPANFYSIPNFGRRTAPPYSDTSILDLNTCLALARSMVAFNERVTARRTLTWTNYNYNLGFAGAPQPGDCVQIQQPSPDPASGEDMITLGPFLILSVSEKGATYTYDVTISADMTAVMGAANPGMSSDQAVAKLIQNR